MLVQRLALGAALAVVGVEAQTTTSTADDGPQTHLVTVGLKSHAFDPAELEAAPGDTVRFEFYPADHSVVEAAFDYPCLPWEHVHAGEVGFYSGVQIVNAISEKTYYNILINDTEPVFYYCGAPGSCLDYNMTGVINPNSSQTLEKQIARIEAVPTMLLPGDDFNREGSPIETASAGDRDGADGDNGSDGGGGGLSDGAIAGIAIGGAAVLILAGAVIYLCGRRGGLEKGYRKSGYFGKGGKPGGATPDAPAAGPAPLVSEGAYIPGSTPDMVSAKHISSAQYSTMGMPSGVTPPVSPAMNTMSMHSGQYAGYQTSEIGSPLMPVQQQYLQAVSPPPPPPNPEPAVAPVELPASADPGNSPLPRYSNTSTAYAWGRQEEAGYRPTQDK